MRRRKNGVSEERVKQNRSSGLQFSYQTGIAAGRKDGNTGWKMEV